MRASRPAPLRWRAVACEGAGEVCLVSSCVFTMTAVDFGSVPLRTVCSGKPAPRWGQPGAPGPGLLWEVTRARLEEL